MTAAPPETGAAEPAPARLGPRHPQVRRLRRLVSHSQARRTERRFVVEGPRAVAAALDAGASLEALYVGPGADAALIARAVAAGVPCQQLAPGVLERVGGTVTPQPVLAVAAAVDVPLEALAPSAPGTGADLVVVCVDVRDPGNLGTVLRSAEAAGAGAVICCDGSVDVYNPKCVRASAGSLFHVRIVAGGDPLEVLERLGAWGLRRLGTRVREGTPYDDADLTGPTALVLGNEAGGLPSGLEPVLDGAVTIPMAGRAESLNVGMTAAVLSFEAARQRRR